MGHETLPEDGSTAGSRPIRDLRGMNPDRATAKQKCERFWTLPWQVPSALRSPVTSNVEAVGKAILSV